MRRGSEEAAHARGSLAWGISLGRVRRVSMWGEGRREQLQQSPRKMKRTFVLGCGQQ